MASGEYRRFKINGELVRFYFDTRTRTWLVSIGEGAKTEDLSYTRAKGEYLLEFLEKVL